MPKGKLEIRKLIGILIRIFLQSLCWWPIETHSIGDTFLQHHTFTNQTPYSQRRATLQKILTSINTIGYFIFCSYTGHRLDHVQ